MTGLGNLLNEGTPEAIQASDMSASTFDALLQQYARQHIETFAMNDTAKPLGSGHVFEVLHPDLGYWNDRQIMYWADKDNKDMGNDYNHSTFLDLILSILLGLRPGTDLADGKVWLTVNPLIDSIQASYFAVDHVSYRGHIVSVVWDGTGTHYNKGVGLSVLVDGQVVANRADLGPLVVSAPGPSNK